MKKFLTNNIGLKILSIVAAFVLWMVVVNVDDPVISRTYTGIPVEVINGDAITDEGKTFEIVDGSNSISVIVSAKRSVIEQMSRDFIKATADMKDMTFMDTVPIEVRTTRFSDRIETISARTKNLKVSVEDLARKQLVINIATNGEVKSGYLLGTITPDVNVLTVSGPESMIGRITTAKAEIDVNGMSSDMSTTAAVKIYDVGGDIVNEPMIDVSVSKIHVKAQILETKDIDILSAVTGVAAEGFGATGGIDCEPATVKIAGAGNVYKNLMHVIIPEGVISVAGARDNIVQKINISGYLPDNVRFADPTFDGIVTVTAYVERMQTTMVDIPITNISITNVPDGYAAHLVEIGPTKQIEIQGIPEVLAQVNPTSITGTIDASSLSPRLNEGEEHEIGMVHTGSNDGAVVFSCPNGVSAVGHTFMEVTILPLDTDNDAGTVTE